MSAGILLLTMSYPSKILLAYIIDIKLNESVVPDWISEIGFTAESSNSIGSILALLVAVVGALLVCSQLYIIFKNARKTSRVLITGMNSGASNFPDELISEMEKMDIRETIKLGLNENGDIGDFIKDSKEMFNAEQKVDIYKRFVLNDGCEKLYLGGLHRTPLLVAYGSRFRANTKNIIFFDKVQKTDTWSLLEEENKKIELEVVQRQVVPNLNGNIGIAIGFTFPVNEGQLPDEFKGHTLFISPNCETGHNLIMNQTNLLSVCHDIKVEVSRLSSIKGVEKIHFFLCVQSTLALAIGMKYQEGMHRNWVIHNYNGQKGTYDWSLEMDANKIS